MQINKRKNLNNILITIKLEIQAQSKLFWKIKDEILGHSFWRAIWCHL